MIFKVPVVAIFTKMDAIDTKVFNELKTSGLSFSEAKKQTPSTAKAKFEKDYLEPLENVNHKPACIVQLRGVLFLFLWLHSPSQPLST